MKCTLVSGPVHLLTEIQLIKEHCQERERKIAMKTAEFNDYFAHPEAILLSLLGKLSQFKYILSCY